MAALSEDSTWIWLDVDVLSHNDLPNPRPSSPCSPELSLSIVLEQITYNSIVEGNVVCVRLQCFSCPHGIYILNSQ